MTAHASFTALVEQLSRMEIMHVWRGYGSALFLELGNLTPTVRRDGTPGNPEGANYDRHRMELAH